MELYDLLNIIYCMSTVNAVDNQSNCAYFFAAVTMFLLPLPTTQSSTLAMAYQYTKNIILRLKPAAPGHPQAQLGTGVQLFPIQQALQPLHLRQSRLPQRWVLPSERKIMVKTTNGRQLRFYWPLTQWHKRSTPLNGSCSKLKGMDGVVEHCPILTCTKKVKNCCRSPWGRVGRVNPSRRVFLCGLLRWFLENSQGDGGNMQTSFETYNLEPLDNTVVLRNILEHD